MMYDAIKRNKHQFEEGDAEYAQQLLFDIPAADVEERRKGYWLRWENFPVLYGSDTLYVCSACSAKYTNPTRYCPFCGAFMNEEGEGQNDKGTGS